MDLDPSKLNPADWAQQKFDLMESDLMDLDPMYVGPMCLVLIDLDNMGIGSMELDQVGFDPMELGSMYFDPCCIRKTRVWTLHPYFEPFEFKPLLHPAFAPL